jgi:hypothetical protein
MAATCRAPTVGRRERERSLSHRYPKVRYDFFSASDAISVRLYLAISYNKNEQPSLFIVRVLENGAHRISLTIRLYYAPLASAICI